MLDIGILSYNNPHKLDSAISHVRKNTTGEYRVLVVDSASTDPLTKQVIEGHAAEDSRIIPRFLDENVGYAKGVNEILRWAENHYVAYVENDVNVLTHGWNDKLIDMMERHHDIGMAFPKTYIAYPIQRDGYIETLWGTGCNWVLNTARLNDVGYFDEDLGHQEEVSYQTRLRIAGYKSGAHPDVDIVHAASTTRNPQAQERINQGVVNWVNHWNKYFVGPSVNYYSHNVTRFEDWPPTALYLEEWYKMQPELQGLNDNPETVYVAALGREVDLIRVPRYQHLYRDRII